MTSQPYLTRLLPSLPTIPRDALEARSHRRRRVRGNRRDRSIRRGLRRMTAARAHETPGEGLLGRCPTGHVGAEYEIEIVSEEGSGSPETLRLLRDPQQRASAGTLDDERGRHLRHPHERRLLTRFWLWDRDLTFAQGGPSLVLTARTSRSASSSSLSTLDSRSSTSPSSRPASASPIPRHSRPSRSRP